MESTVDRQYAVIFNSTSEGNAPMVTMKIVINAERVNITDGIVAFWQDDEIIWAISTKRIIEVIDTGAPAYKAMTRQLELVKSTQSDN